MAESKDQRGASTAECHKARGVVTISAEPFRYALGRMKELAGYKMARITP
jgi:hypothetical protein